MKLLLDQGLPRSAVEALGIRQLAAAHVAELGLSTASDEEVLQAARERHAIVATLDADFHSMLAASHATTPSVIRIRIEGLKGDDIAALLEQVLGAIESELSAGAAVTITHSGVRLRMLPLP